MKTDIKKTTIRQQQNLEKETSEKRILWRQEENNCLE
jgi:hypothetical protein